MTKKKEDVKQVAMDIAGNQFILTESRSMRDELVFKDSVLDRVKLVPQLPNTIEVTVEMAANFYEANIETVKTILKRHRDEFNEYDEVRVLKGKSLAEFKTQVQGELELGNAPSLTLISRRGLLRIGMLLTESEIAKSVRNYLLNVEEIAPEEQRKWAIEREISKRERRQLTDAIRDFYHGSMKHGIAYSAFTNLVYDLVFNTNAKGLQQYYNLDDGDSIRDALSTEDLRKIVRAEKTISSLLLIGKGMKEIREELLKHKDKFQDAV